MNTCSLKNIRFSFPVARKLVSPGELLWKLVLVQGLILPRYLVKLPAELSSTESNLVLPGWKSPFELDLAVFLGPVWLQARGRGFEGASCRLTNCAGFPQLDPSDEKAIPGTPDSPLETEIATPMSVRSRRTSSGCPRTAEPRRS